MLYALFCTFLLPPICLNQGSCSVRIIVKSDSPHSPGLKRKFWVLLKGLFPTNLFFFAVLMNDVVFSVKNCKIKTLRRMLMMLINLNIPIFIKSGPHEYLLQLMSILLASYSSRLSIVLLGED
jgi:hypothetical protein